MLLFKKHWELHPSLAQNVLSGCLATIRAERTGQLIDRQLLRRLLAMLVSLGCFSTQFKPLLAADLARFFAEESARMLCDSEVSVFLLYCERRLKEEAENLGAIMSPCDCSDMVRTVQKVLLESNIDAILSGGLATLVDSSRFQGHSCIPRQTVIFFLFFSPFFLLILLDTHPCLRPVARACTARPGQRTRCAAALLCVAHQSDRAAARAGALLNAFVAKMPYYFVAKTLY